jgi:hypothetical protein
VTALFYYSLSTVFGGATPGSRAVDLLRLRLPALFTVHEHRAHA